MSIFVFINSRSLLSGFPVMNFTTVPNPLISPRFTLVLVLALLLLLGLKFNFSNISLILSRLSLNSTNIWVLNLSL